MTHDATRIFCGTCGKEFTETLANLRAPTAFRCCAFGAKVTVRDGDADVRDSDLVDMVQRAVAATVARAGDIVSFHGRWRP